MTSASLRDNYGFYGAIPIRILLGNSLERNCYRQSGVAWGRGKGGTWEALGAKTKKKMKERGQKNYGIKGNKLKKKSKKTSKKSKKYWKNIMEKLKKKILVKG